ncbi:cysteine desulfurase [Paraliobacillus ryukyuensis]|uniref:Selenocysteine lyase/cysteine desulfurase n=1 Tax=Paraliobacillus ryukyuensis TaxID=200904 RepID=A0A366EDD8_9BACI|nr:aminotransferase class V-fold PLP-dependent enzyme [Paraliobacillus ryukyuensis]RBP00333.1 selenocysteine lyase/cysteine desulfurase [Paraliobacillus ryukyuensis]
MFKAKIGSKTLYPKNELENYFDHFRKNVVGYNQLIKTPYGDKRMIYADWTASGRLYRPIEAKLLHKVGPWIGNTHTESTITGSTTTAAYDYAKDVIKKHVNANENDVLIATGAGMTDAVNKLQRLMGIRVPKQLQQNMKINEADRPIIFVSHMEHHSNYLSWKETIGDCIMLPADQYGNVDTVVLEHYLKQYTHRKLKIGAFTACSNVTGLQTDYHQLARLMHEYGGICFIDFAASAPYVAIDMHPTAPQECLDGIFFSPHKFLGGPGSSGLLLVSKNHITSDIPDNPGGGTVLWTDNWGGYKYSGHTEAREDGGTPGFLQLIRAALAIKLKEQMGVDAMQDRKREVIQLFVPLLNKMEGVSILGNAALQACMGIISFRVEEIHHQLVVKLLNDRFGIQTRGGCSCAGPYGHYLLDIDPDSSAKMAKAAEAGNMALKPGWIRVSLHPIMSDKEVLAISYALQQIIEHKQEWAEDYDYDPKSDTFVYKHDSVMKNINMEQLFDFTD